ncbi:tyrosine recombinase XerC [Planomonospora parontospora subsp. parontospora]|uniref:Tyrosine recombinase XerC n=2 Tax=Planomonospora parontospora TaxID=58119 RepID=A0AA37F817_9ACTN|nr:tyrosine-type recombinase/integrase [Planomonospora parontospora]GGK93970.1 tyrosine recombinase XerC [Planomonospora parontospora]GII13210.1 tyrosine recombinase XerC [Planomonospora parontospora subsp. parontospora]
MGASAKNTAATSGAAPGATPGAAVVPIRPAAGPAAAAATAIAAFETHLARCALAANTVVAYRRQARAYRAWLDAHAAEHPDAFADTVGAEAAVAAWRRHLLAVGAAPATVNQALAAVELLYAQAVRIRIHVKNARVPRPGAPDALTRAAENAVRRAADRRGSRDAALIALLLGTGARAEECQRLTVADVPLTARTGTVRLHGKGDQVRTVPLPAPARTRLNAWLHERTDLLTARSALADRIGDGLWSGQRGRLSIDGVTDVVRAVGKDAGLPSLRPHRLRHTYATRLREGGADPAQIQALLGHASIETSARYFRASAAEVAALVDRALDY